MSSVFLIALLIKVTQLDLHSVSVITAMTLESLALLCASLVPLHPRAVLKSSTMANGELFVLLGPLGLTKARQLLSAGCWDFQVARFMDLFMENLPWTMDQSG